MKRPRTRGVTAASETKWRATQQSPRCQTAMMVHHFTAGGTAPMLRFPRWDMTLRHQSRL
jgi:hypothetical protein